MIKRFLCTFAALASLANAGTLFLPAYPNALLVFDEGQGQIVDRKLGVWGIREFVNVKTVWCK